MGLYVDDGRTLIIMEEQLQSRVLCIASAIRFSDKPQAGTSQQIRGQLHWGSRVIQLRAVRRGTENRFRVYVKGSTDIIRNLGGSLDCSGQS